MQCCDVIPNALKHLFNPVSKYNHTNTVLCVEVQKPKTARALFIEAALRTALAVAGIFIFLNTSVSIPVALVVGAIISIPATALAVGGILAWSGILLTITGIMALSLAEFAIGLGLLAAGWLTMHFYDILPYGLVDQCIIQKCAEKHQHRLI